jgi:O-antigen ligase
VWRRVNVWIHEAGAKLFLTASGVVVLASALIFSLSRSGIAFSLVGCAVFALLIPRSVVPEGKRHSHTRRRALHLLLALALLIVGIVAWIGLDPVVHRFQLLPDEWEKEKGRLQVWIDSWEAVQDFTFTGAGLGSFRYVFPLYRTFGGVIYYSCAHNDYLQALIELGVPGMALIILAVALLWRRAGQIRRRLEGQPDLAFQHAGYTAAALTVALHSFTDFGLHMPANAALFAVVVGVIVGLEERR